MFDIVNRDYLFCLNGGDNIRLQVFQAPYKYGVLSFFLILLACREIR